MKALVTAMLFAAAIVSCGKEYVFENAGSGTNKTQKDTTDGDTDGDSIPDFITVKTALDKDYGEDVCVGGYIVASCTKNIKNIDYTYPFEGSTAIIIADDTIGADSIVPTEIMPVCLTEWPQLRSGLNLVDNPELHNKRVILNGTISKYLYRKGLKGVTSAIVDDEH